MAVHFKFRSAVAFDSICVDDSGITVGSLREKIVEQKHLGLSSNFDLVITNADSGEEYIDDAFLVPKDTSVIIKRVPAKVAKTLPVNELKEGRLDDHALDHPRFQFADKYADPSQLALISPIDELYDMDDFGVDLYALDESALTHVETDETSNASGFLQRTFTNEKRHSEENATARAHGKDGSGNLIQHCPANRDSSYDMKRGSTRRADREDLSTSLAVSQPKLIFTDADVLPPELQCSLCQGIFKEPVMIPCCQFSFCDSCAKQYTVEKGGCPQCGSDMSKIDDLLPNVALWQAIEGFTGLVPSTKVPKNGADVESATKAAKIVSSATKPPQTSSIVKDQTSVVMVENQPDAPAVDDSVCESGVGTKEKPMGEGSKIITPFGESSSSGKKKKKPSFRSPSISEMLSDHPIGKSRKVNKCCFVCGSPDHIARNCTANPGDNSACFSTPLGVFRASNWAVPPRAINPFGHEMFWPGGVPYGAPGLPLGPYAPLPYGPPALPVGHYGVSSFSSPMYPNPQMHGFLSSVPGRILPAGDRPLSREEFMELQERERMRRLVQERKERELSQERALSVSESEQLLCSDSDQSLRKQWPPPNKFQGNFRRYDMESSVSKEIANTKNKQKHIRRYAHESVQEHTEPEQYDELLEEDPETDNFRGPVLYSQRVKQDVKPVRSMMKKANKLLDCSPRSDHEECQLIKSWGFTEAHSKWSKHITSRRLDGRFENHEHKSYVKHDGTRVSEAGAAEMLRSSCHKSKRAAMERARIIYSSQSMEIPVETQDAHHFHGLVSDYASSFEALEDPSTHKHQMESTLVMLNPSIDETRKKKKKKRRNHRKRKVECAKDISMEGVTMEGGYTKFSKKHRSHHTSSLVDKSSTDSLHAALDNIEETRWQMYAELEDESNEVRHPFKGRFKHHRNMKSALQKL